MQKGYITHRRTPIELRMDLGDLGEIIHQLPADSSERRSLERLEMQIKTDLHTSIGYEVESN